MKKFTVIVWDIKNTAAEIDIKADRMEIQKSGALVFFKDGGDASGVYEEKIVDAFGPAMWMRVKPAKRQKKEK